MLRTQFAKLSVLLLSVVAATVTAPPLSAQDGKPLPYPMPGFQFASEATVESALLVADALDALTSSTTLLSSSPNPSVFGASVTLTATVSAAEATGKVTFYDGTAVLGVGVLIDGTATLRTSLLPAGNRNLRAYYPGDALYAPSSSAVSVHAVRTEAANRYLAAVNYPVVSGPRSVAIGDFNGDHHADLAATNQSSAKVSVLLGDGNGTFQPAASYTTGIEPVAVTVGDLDGDGNADLAVANAGSFNVSVLLGNGSGTFQPAKNYRVGLGPAAVVVGDFNEDGAADLVASNWNSGSLSVLLGRGDGTFQAAVNYPAGSGPEWMTVGDFNGDGHADLAVANSNSNTVSVLLGNGDGTFQSDVKYTAGRATHSVATDDFNADGAADLAVTDIGGGNVVVLLGNGDGTFEPPVDYASGASPAYVATGDLNGDGRVDLAVTNYGGATVSVLLGNGDGTFQPAVADGAGSNPASVVIGDFNDDGRADLAVANSGSNDVSVLLGYLAAAVSVRSGDGQSGAAGQPLADPLVVEVTDPAGAPVPGVTVIFTVTTGAATVDPSVTLTGLAGTASTLVTLGETVGEATVTATVVGFAPVVFTLTVSPGAPGVRINSGGVVGAGLSVPSVRALSSNSIAAVFGENFAPAGTYESVTTADLVNGRIPTNLLGVCVLVGETASPIFFVVPTQINFQVPQIPESGTVEVRVVTGCGTANEVRSAPEVVSVQPATPEFFYFQLNATGINPVAGYNAATYVFVGAPDLLPGATFAPAKPGDVLTLFLTGLGATSPAFEPGVLPDSIAQITGLIQVTIGDVTLAPADIIYAGVTPGSAGLYQINIQVPDSVQSGNQPIVVSINGTASSAGAYLAVQQ